MAEVLWQVRPPEWWEWIRSLVKHALLLNPPSAFHEAAPRLEARPLAPHGEQFRPADWPRRPCLPRPKSVSPPLNCVLPRFCDRAYPQVLQ